jgi:hypothetical protein
MLTKPQIEFLRSQQLTEEDVFNGRGMPKTKRESAARHLGKAVILTDVACAKGGHFLRNRSGHCVQCDTSKLAYQKRYREKQTIYIAGSQSSQLLKVGVTANPSDRHQQMNDQAYGGYSDWQFLFQVIVPDAGKVESQVLKELSRYQADGEYLKDGKTQTAREILSAPIQQVYQTLAKVIQQTKIEFDKTTAKKSGNWAHYH